MFTNQVSCAVDLYIYENDDFGKGKTLQERHLLELGSGMQSLFLINKYVEDGAKDALSVVCDFGLNFDILFNYSGLISFLDSYFPDIIVLISGAGFKEKILPGHQYMISTFDIS